MLRVLMETRVLATFHEGTIYIHPSLPMKQLELVVAILVDLLLWVAQFDRSTSLLGPLPPSLMPKCKCVKC